jgi:hypothetical protein
MKEPSNSWDDQLFSYYGYDSLEEAQEAILEKGCVNGEYVILPVISKVISYE